MKVALLPQRVCFGCGRRQATLSSSPPLSSPFLLRTGGGRGSDKAQSVVAVRKAWKPRWGAHVEAGGGQGRVRAVCVCETDG